MITRVDYYLPKTELGADFFRQLQVLLASLNQCTIHPNTIGLSHPALSMSTWFHLSDQVDVAHILYMDDSGKTVGDIELPNFIVPAREPLDDKAVLISEALCSPNGNTIDHTGLILPNTHNRQKLWENLVTPLLGHEQLYDYPHSAPEYDADAMRWLFLMPEKTENAPDYAGARQPKFELVCDADAPPTTVLQIDIETNYTTDDLALMLPGSTSIAGLESEFRSLTFSTAWPSLPTLRLDFRSKDSGADWRNGQWIQQNGQKLSAGCSQLKAPALV